MRISKFLRLSPCAALLVAAACNSDSTGPATLSNPQATIAAVAALDSAFNTATLASFGALSGSIGSTAATAALARAGTIVRATVPHPATTGVAAEAAAVKQLSGLRALNLSPANPQGPVINDTLYGSIYTYDTSWQAYVRSATTGGPANGVRFILYAINPLTGNIATPLSPVGQTDLLDESVGTTAKLHIIVTGNGGTPTYLDYTAALTFSQTSLVATLDGSLTNALGGGANKTLQFSVNATFTLTTITVHGTYSLNNPAVTITLDAADKQVTPTDSVTLAFKFTRQGEAITFSGLLVTTSDVVDTVDATIKVNGQPYASVRGNNLAVRFFDASGQEIIDTTQKHDILVALEGIQFAVVLVIQFSAALFAPIVNLLNS
ncbi:MAG TPA: hypothetical protein VFI79_02705 [Gemmatimonadales bacterium]|nr:hypothetical protein [Gemmatimonadales bacterium]